jgi:hypothetical protein
MGRFALLLSGKSSSSSRHSGLKIAASVLGLSAVFLSGCGGMSSNSNGKIVESANPNKVGEGSFQPNTTATKVDAKAIPQ